MGAEHWRAWGCRAGRQSLTSPSEKKTQQMTKAIRLTLPDPLCTDLQGLPFCVIQQNER